jgi:hypothetical protein
LERTVNGTARRRERRYILRSRRLLGSGGRPLNFSR